MSWEKIFQVKDIKPKSTTNNPCTHSTLVEKKIYLIHYFGRTMTEFELIQENYLNFVYYQ